MTTPPPPPASVRSIPTVFNASQERTFAMMTHFAMIPAAFFGPLILWTFGKDRSPFVDHQGKEALNFSIVVSIAVACGVVLTFLSFADWRFAVAGGLLMAIATVGGMIMAVVGAMSAYRGELYSYPITIRFAR